MEAQFTALSLRCLRRTFWLWAQAEAVAERRRTTQLGYSAVSPSFPLPQSRSRALCGESCSGCCVCVTVANGTCSLSLSLSLVLFLCFPQTPAAIYLDVPPPVSTSRPKGSGNLGEQLLAPTTTVCFIIRMASFSRTMTQEKPKWRLTD